MERQEQSGSARPDENKVPRRVGLCWVLHSTQPNNTFEVRKEKAVIFVCCFNMLVNLLIVKIMHVSEGFIPPWARFVLFLGEKSPN